MAPACPSLPLVGMPLVGMPLMGMPRTRGSVSQGKEGHSAGTAKLPCKVSQVCVRL